MGQKIEAHEYQLLKIFSSDFDYQIPPYQRPYSWTEEEVSTLFDDLYDFFIEEGNENYFLGSIVLIKEDNKPKSDIIDGQQRLTSLSLLISSIASKSNEEDKDKLKEYLIEPGNKFAGLSAKPRLTLREKDNDFFHKYIQEIQIQELLNLEESQLNEPKKHILNNTKIFIDKIEKNFGDDFDKLEKFSMFLLQRCYLVAVSTSSQTSAFRIFSVMNSRGLPLLATDIIKSEVIGKINQNEQEKYTLIWENLEEKLGRDDFNNLFSQIRMIYSKSKAKKNLLDEFRASVLSEFKDNPTDFINNVLVPYSESYYIIKNECYEGSEELVSDEINNLLKWLNKIDNSDWIAPAIVIFSNNANSEIKLEFLRQLERLAAYLHISAKDINFRISRYAKIIDEIQQNKELIELDLTIEEIEQFKDLLNGDIYTMIARRRNYFILRLDSFVSDGGAEYNPRVLTIEHVLPQTINQNSEWESIWFDNLNEEEQNELHYKWLHKIGNLVPLTRQKNSSAQNFNFQVKKEKYFTGKSGISSYNLTTQVLKESEWTEEVVARRQKKLIEVFKENWNL